MARCIFRNGKIVEDYGRPYIIAEVNSSHNGKLEVARQMIDVAVEIGCDCVKFQSWSVDSLYSRTYYDDNPIAKRFVSKFSLSPEQLKEMAMYSKEKGIDFSSTPYSEEEVDFLLDECEAPFLKIASMELNNISFLRYIAQKKVPIVLSTGMGTLEEVERAINVLKSEGAANIVLLHCVSIYPTMVDTINLKNIEGLRRKFSAYPIGFSDHTEGDAASVAATALGAAVIEKHLTLDRAKVGMDNGMATEPEPFKLLVDKCHMIQLGMGTENRVVLPEEYEQRKKMRRSVIAVRDLPAGYILTRADLYAKRPGTGISPDKLDLLVGKKLQRDVLADTLLKSDDIVGGI